MTLRVPLASSPAEEFPLVDPWLERWLPLVRGRTGKQPVLELGCGAGADTATLLSAGHRVVALDSSTRALAIARSRVPGVELHHQDMRAPLPVQAGALGVVVASLCLHYFEWSETTLLVERIRSTLRPGGVLLCRVNSTNDHYYGASGYSPISDNYYFVHGEKKRFFDRESLQALFGTGWLTLASEELVIHKYAHPKTVWEIVVERDG